MIRSLALACVLSPFAAGEAFARAQPEGGFSYTPPTTPAAMDPSHLLVRLFGLTAAILALCFAVLWLSKRNNRRVLAKGNAAGLMRLEGTLALDRRSSLHIVNVDGHTVAVTTDASGLRSMTILSEPFEEVLEDVEAREAA